MVIVPQQLTARGRGNANVFFWGSLNFFEVDALRDSLHFLHRIFLESPGVSQHMGGIGKFLGYIIAGSCREFISKILTRRKVAPE